MCTLNEAKEILGNKNVFGPEEWTRIFGINTIIDNSSIEIPWSAEVLRNPGINQSHFLFLGVDEFNGKPLNLQAWCDYFQGTDHPKFLRSGGIWFLSEEFSQLTCLSRWYLMTKSVALGSKNVYYYQQLSMLPENYEVPTAIERVTGNLLYHLQNGSYLDDFPARMRDIDSSNTTVYIGIDPNQGIFLGNKYEGARETFGISASLSNFQISINEPNFPDLKNNDWYVRWRTTKFLGNLKENKYTKALCESLNDPIEYVRDEAIKSLILIGSPAVDSLCDIYNQADKNPRKGIVKALGEIGDKRAVDTVISAIKDPDPGIRTKAADALGNLMDDRALEALTISINDPDEYVRSSTVISLGKYGKLAIDPLCVALTDSKNLIKASAAHTLGKIGDERAVGPLSIALRGDNEYVSESASEALKNIGSPSVGVFCDALKDEKKKVRFYAAFALCTIADERALEPLCAALKDTDIDVRSRAAQALGKIGDGRAVEPLCAALKDTQALVRSFAASSLGDIHDRRAVKSLCDALTDASNIVRKSAAQALGEIGDEKVIKQLQQAIKKEDSYEVFNKSWHEDVKKAAQDAIEKIDAKK